MLRFAVISALSCGVATAAEQIEKLQAGFTAERNRRIAPQLDRYVRKLAELEAMASQRRNYVLAGRIRREYLTSTAQWHEATGTERGIINLIASTGFTWRLPPGVERGAYSIALEYQLTGEPTGIVFNGGNFRLSRTLEASDGEVRACVFRPLLLDDNAASFSIEVQDDAAQLIIKAVTLEKLESIVVNEQKKPEAALASLKKLEPEAMQEGKRDAGSRLYFMLVSLEQQFAAAGKYQRAIAVKEEMAALEEIHGSLEPSSVKKVRIALKPEKAQTTGAIRFDRTENVLVGWKNEGNAASWDIRSIQPGRYKVIAFYGVSDSQTDRSSGKRQRAGASFVVRKESGLVGEAPERIIHRVSSTGGWDKITPVECGQMAISRKSATIVVECGSAEELGVMHLRGIELRRMTTVAPGENARLRARFATLRSAHAREMDAQLTPIENSYIAELQKSKQLALAKTEMKRVRGDAAARREQIAGKELIAAAPHTDGHHVLSATDSLTTFLAGQAAAHSSGEFVTGLRPPGAYVQWNLDRLRIAPGDYEVTIDFRTAEKMGGKFRIISGSEQLTDRIRLSPFGTLNRDFRSKSAGKLRITAAARTIRLEPVELDSREGVLCDLRGITLTSITAAVAADRQHPDGYTEWNRVILVKAASNTGDSFYVRHRSKKHRLRLFAVTCPPGSVREAKKDAFKSARDHFGVSANDLARGGRQAAQMVEDLLGREPFTIFTNGKKTKGGALFAWILVEDDTLLSARLIEKGLAGISGEEAAVPEVIGRGFNHGKYKTWLEAREKEAAEKKEGIWRYHRD